MKTIITIIRIAVGWHFLYEGLIKLFADKWSSASYLNNTFGFLSGFYHWLAASPVRLEVVDFLNIWGLILIGLALFVGLFAKWASISGAFLLMLYYLAYPPFGVSLFGGDGATYIINPLFIETALLVFLFGYKDKGYGLDELLPRLKKAKRNDVTSDAATDAGNSRREMIKHVAALPVLGLFGWGAYRSGQKYGVDTLSGATIQVNRVALGELKGVLPQGKIGEHALSRLVIGSNVIGGWVHARDLIYVESLARTYNTEKKIFETLMLSEQAGINSINIFQSQIPTMVKYKKITGSKIKCSVQVRLDEENKDRFVNVKNAIDSGMEILQMHGAQCDCFVRDSKTELIGTMVDFIRSQGYIAGIAGHPVHTFLACEDMGIIPDYYMITMHHDNYWSAHPREFRKTFETQGGSKRDRNLYHDNLFCTFPDETVEFVNRAKIPVMGYKVLAAGAIYPKDGFKWAFENGADFICVGMFDFQIVDDVNICLETLQHLTNRTRAWYS